MNRAERRRRQKQYETAIDRGIDIDEMDQGLMIALIQRTIEHVERSRRSGRVDDLMSFIYRAMDKSSSRLADVPTACSKGCWYCCSIWVAAKAPEVFYFAKTMPGEQKNGYTQRLAATMNTVRGLSFDDRGDMVTPCPALVDNLCSNYRSRPNVCRTAVSADADICKRSYIDVSGEAIPTPMAHTTVRGIFATALDVALRQSGLAYASREFNSAMEMAINEPDLERRWLSGEDVFSAIPPDPDSAGDIDAVEFLREMAFG